MYKVCGSEIMCTDPSEAVAVVDSERVAHTTLSSNSPGAPGGLASALSPMLVEGGGVVSPLHTPPHARPGHGFGGRPAGRQGEGSLCLCMSPAYESQGKGIQLV